MPVTAPRTNEGVAAAVWNSLKTVVVRHAHGLESGSKRARGSREGELGVTIKRGGISVEVMEVWNLVVVMVASYSK